MTQSRLMLQNFGIIICNPLYRISAIGMPVGGYAVWLKSQIQHQHIAKHKLASRAK